MKDAGLTDEQKRFVLENFDKMTLLELTQKTFNNTKLDGRSIEGKIIKAFLGEKSLNYKIVKHEKVNEIILKPEDEEYIRNNASVMNATEMARVLFKNPILTPLNKETLTVYQFVKSLPIELTRPQEAIPDGQYSPPKALSRVVGKINRFCNLSWNEEKLSNKEKECAMALIRYLHSYRFLAMINSYQTQKDRDLFESQFIFHTFDKPDLISEEVNTYLNLCSEYVIQASAQEQKELLDQRLRNLAEDSDARMSVSLNDAISGKAEEISSSVVRQKNLINDLVGERKKRIANKGNDNASIANLFELWKNKEERDTMIKLAQQRQLLVKDEINRLGSIDDYMAKIQGITQDEVLF